MPDRYYGPNDGNSPQNLAIVKQYLSSYHDVSVQPGLTRKHGAAAPTGGTPFWGDAPELWDTIYFGKERMPGLCTVAGSCKLRLDRKPIPGTHGESQTRLGYQPAEVDVVVAIWTAEQLQAFERLARKLRPRQGTPDPIDVQHPSLQVVGLRSFTIQIFGVLEKMHGGPLEPSDFYVCKIRLLEYNRRRSKVSTPKKSNFDIRTLGPGAIQERIDAKGRTTPSNQAPNKSFVVPGLMPTNRFGGR